MDIEDLDRVLFAPRDWYLLLAITYAVVVFSILVQGLTLSPLLRWAVAQQPEEVASVSSSDDSGA